MAFNHLNLTFYKTFSSHFTRGATFKAPWSLAQRQRRGQRGKQRPARVAREFFNDFLDMLGLQIAVITF